MYADIILPLALEGRFTYEIPESMNLDVGYRVIVPFGPRKMIAGIVWEIHNRKPKDFDLKNIEQVLDDRAFVTPNQLKLWEWISSYYICKIGQVLMAALPAGLKMESETRVRYNAEYIESVKLSKRENEILDILSNSKAVSLKDLYKSLNVNNCYKNIKTLFECNAIIVEENIASTYHEKKQKYVKLKKNFNEDNLTIIIDSLSKARKQKELFMVYLDMSKYLFQEKPERVKLTSLLSQTKSSNAILKSLVDKNILIVEEDVVSRIDSNVSPTKSISELSLIQNKAYIEIKESFQKRNTVLLHGVTSSGKTEIYIKLIDECLAKGKQVLYLLPEIALTTQIINRLSAVFGSKVLIYHSKLNDSERVEVYKSLIEENETRIILGVRSSVFLPIKNLGLVIVDEEHESTYKQYDPSPRYHARDTAIYLAFLNSAKCLLGTATPSIESYQNASSGKYGLVELFKRHGDIALPKVQLIDIKERYRKKRMKSVFSLELLDRIKHYLDDKKQVILFQNRRGYSNFLECKSCGWVAQCPNCSVSYTYHRYNNSLQCHYCGHQIQVINKCEQCGENKLQEKGVGTEKIEEELSRLIPEARIARLDLDTGSNKNAYRRIIAEFEDNKIDILIGTQMISKGLDFENVKLVGVLNADTMLNFPDFRAFERSFQTISQVAGRAGRKGKQGEVIIQTYNTENEIIKQIVNHDYKQMFIDQSNERKEFYYPPYVYLIKIIIKHKNEKTCNQAAKILTKELFKIFGNRVIGAHKPLVSKVKNKYIENIILKFEKNTQLNKAKYILNIRAFSLKQLKGYSNLDVSFDVDPY
ncbi:MAG: primosomal protein N' [Marinifilaceae bacterium]|jgi:primosomal protein N' (replication factor Y)|nr:primosomal protein N' [Marinifilaceae bacterium]